MDITEARRLVFDEFKLVQEKIDRIGEFLFKIRAWSITANSGITLAVLSLKLTPLAIFVGGGATLAFWRLEKHQRGLRDGYSDRAVALESALAKLQSEDARVSGPVLMAGVLRHLRRVPGIAHSSRRDFAVKEARSTREDNLYRAQLVLLLLALTIRLLIKDLTILYDAVTELCSLALSSFLEVLRCG